MNKLMLRNQIEHFFIEDLGEVDITAESSIASNAKGKAYIKAKEDGVMAGMALLSVGYHILDPTITVTCHIADGELFRKGDVIASMEGNVIQLLAGERVLLNLLQRMSGIATMTTKAISALEDKSIRICDTRKTTPGLRMLEKYAVCCGGGFNHRRNLSDAVLLKENHLVAAGGIQKAVNAVREKIGHMVKVEVETTNEREVLEAIEAKVDVIMFDNATPEKIKEYVKLVPSGITTEASGGINLESLPSFNGCGVHYISLGCLTHSVKSIDLSFLLEGEAY
ncbi:carboxylating nicotinate-nucleotide diphosphorylase [Halalkalibacter alkalisediminis]|uniref:nicotinate-nucleotide diphosphorylase (carboxylating) n=1 Tax=Halalkalibacter alkalisediminis TaxID=935616 RepID=A0ABV6NM30_9BACI|nr:carboxylating nicotinate-nucleotide diphosphorylase [Halalkalibacter alkalisediminis]